MVACDVGEARVDCASRLPTGLERRLFALLEQFGFALTDVFVPSLLQAKARWMDVEPGHFQDEHAVTTIGLIPIQLR